jgi:hypothetical protein
LQLYKLRAVPGNGLGTSRQLLQQSLLQQRRDAARSRPVLATEALMRTRTLTALTILAIGTITTAGPVRAQTYDPSYPVCLHVFGRVGYYECRYSSLPQCAMSASGRSADCVVNPYFTNAYQQSPPHRHRRYRHAY